MKYTLSNKILLVPVAFLFFVVLYSCKKDGAAANYVISYTGNLFAGDTITFRVSGTNGASVAWDFGDSTTSTDSTPTHIYKTAEPYIVKVISNNGSKTQKSFTIGDLPGCEYTHLMAGTRHWYGSVSPYMRAYYLVADTLITVNVIDDATVQMGNVVLRYVAIDTLGNNVWIEFRSPPDHFYGDFYSICYYINSDSMVLQSFLYRGDNIYLYTF